MKMFSSVLAVLLASAFIAIGCGTSFSQQEGERAPIFTLQDLNGNAVSLSQYQGKVVILDFFADWCPPCRQEIPDFIALEKDYGRKGLAVIGVAVVAKDDARAFAKDMGINYPVLIDDGKASGMYGPIRSIPTTFIIDKNGRIAKKYIGYRPRSTFEADVQELLK